MFTNKRLTGTNLVFEEIKADGIDTDFFHNVHLFSFTDKTISLMLRKNGFEVSVLDTERSKWRHMSIVAYLNHKDIVSINYFSEGDNWKYVKKLIQKSRRTGLLNRIFKVSKRVIRRLRFQ